MDRQSEEQHAANNHNDLNEINNHRLDDMPGDQLSESSNQVPLRQESLADWSAKVSRVSIEI